MMKKITVLLFICIVSALGCAGNFDSSTTKGFVTMDFDTTYTWTPANAKEYTGVAGNSCGPNDSCLIVYYSGTLSDTAYTGLALKDDTNTFNLEIFKTASAAEYTVVFKDGNSIYNCTALPGYIFTTEPSDGDSDGYADGQFTGNTICGSGQTYGNAAFNAKVYP